MIDHIWTNKVSSSYYSGILISSLSDHFPVFHFEEGKHRKHDLPDRITRKIDSKSIPGFCKLLKSTSWSNVLNQQNPKVAFDNFFEIYYSARDISFPEVKVKHKSKKFKHNPWMSQGLIKSQKREEKLFAKKVKYPTRDNIEIFKLYNTVYNKVRRAAKTLFYDKQFKRFAKDSKQTWS